MLDLNKAPMPFNIFIFQYKEGKKLRPKPNYNSVDLSEVEWEDRDENVSDKTTKIEIK